MPEIKILFHITASREKVYEAISSIQGLSNWWTLQTCGDSSPGGIIRFRFGEFGNDMRVLSMRKNEWLLWECVDGPDDWIGTRISFQLDDNGNKARTRVRFEHGCWKTANDFFAGCTFTWGRYMESLRQYCQTGKGEAFGSDGYRQ
jgi:uncharacterized protein YndB with AHSA1/START domain